MHLPCGAGVGLWFLIVAFPITCFFFKFKINMFNSKYIEDIYCYVVNSQYVSSSVLKTSDFLRVRSTSENSDVFNSRDEIYLVFILYFFIAMSH